MAPSCTTVTIATAAFAAMLLLFSLYNADDDDDHRQPFIPMRSLLSGAQSPAQAPVASARLVPPGTPDAHNVSSCPVDSLNFGLCYHVVAAMLNVSLGIPPTYPCCSVFDGLLDAEIAFCFCTTLVATVFGLDYNVPIRLTILLNRCGKSPPPGFVCSSN